MQPGASHGRGSHTAQRAYVRARERAALICAGLHIDDIEADLHADRHRTTHVVGQCLHGWACLCAQRNRREIGVAQCHSGGANEVAIDPLVAIEIA
ncbi:hypothetical protein D3C87_1929010 [compost metagenome]